MDAFIAPNSRDALRAMSSCKKASQRQLPRFLRACPRALWVLKCGKHPYHRGPNKKKLLFLGGGINLEYIIPFYIVFWNCKIQNALWKARQKPFLAKFREFVIPSETRNLQENAGLTSVLRDSSAEPRNDILSVMIRKLLWETVPNGYVLLKPPGLISWK